MVVDPLGLPRCSLCGNAFSYERHEGATRFLRDRGLIPRNGFVCVRCVERAEREYGPFAWTARREKATVPRCLENASASRLPYGGTPARGGGVKA
jgi:hypothetical protein